MTDREFRALAPQPRSPSGRPQPGEYAAYAHPDIALIPEDDAVAALRSSRDRVAALFSPLTDARVAGVRYAPGKWTIKDLLGRSVRAASITLFAGLGPEAWPRRGTLEGHDVTVRGLAFHIVGHEMHHLRVLRERYLPLVSPG